jgi:AraC-like DNA-binding protein
MRISVIGRMMIAIRQLGRGENIYSWVNTLLHKGEALTPDTMSAALLVRMLRGAVAEGGDRRALLAGVGINNERLRNPLSRVSSQLVLRFFAVLERQFGDPAITLRIGEKASMQNFSDFGYATRLEANLAAVIEANIRIQLLRQNMFQTIFDPVAKPPVLLWNTHPDNIIPYAPFMEFSVATYARLSRQILGEPPLLREVHFQHKPRFASERYEKAFGCPVRFSMPETKMELAARQLFRPSPHANANLLAVATERYRQPAGWMAEGRLHLAHSYFYLSNEIDKSPPTLDRMASSFGMGERSLRRKLVEEGYPFRELLDRVRQDLCGLYIIENKRSLGEIALLLGYSDLSAFTRAHKRWHGTAPSKADI